MKRRKGARAGAPPADFLPGLSMESRRALWSGARFGRAPRLTMPGALESPKERAAIAALAACEGMDVDRAAGWVARLLLPRYIEKLDAHYQRGRRRTEDATLASARSRSAAAANGVGGSFSDREIVAVAGKAGGADATVAALYRIAVERDRDPSRRERAKVPNKRRVLAVLKAHRSGPR